MVNVSEMAPSGNRKNTTSDAVDIIFENLYKGKPKRVSALQKEYLNARLARAIYDLRTGAGLTQKQLADLVGTHASAISRLENADYGGHSLQMLQKIAAVFSGRIEIRFVPASKAQRYLRTPEGKQLDIKQVVA